MESAFSKLHPAIMVPAVIILWLLGSAALIFILSFLNFPGINEHGTGVLILFAAWLLSIVVALVHIIYIFRLRLQENRGDSNDSKFNL